MPKHVTQAHLELAPDGVVAYLVVDVVALLAYRRKAGVVADNAYLHLDAMLDELAAYAVECVHGDVANTGALVDGKVYGNFHLLLRWVMYHCPSMQWTVMPS